MPWPTTPAEQDRATLNQLTVLHWFTATEIGRGVATRLLATVSVRDVVAVLTDLQGRGHVVCRPREEAGHRYGAREYQMTIRGVAYSNRLVTPGYQPFGNQSPHVKTRAS